MNRLRRRYGLPRLRKIRQQKAKAFLKLEDRLIRLVRGGANPESQAMKNLAKEANRKLHEYTKAHADARKASGGAG